MIESVNQRIGQWYAVPDRCIVDIVDGNFVEGDIMPCVQSDG